MESETNDSPNELKYLSWGAWGISYEDSDKRYNSNIDASFWVAGKRTTEDQITQLASTAPVGRYNGDALGVSLNSNGDLTHLTNGQFEIEADFASHTLSGQIKFDQINLEIGEADIATGSFSTSITGQDIHYGKTNGAFFGPSAENVGGNFIAENIDKTKYIGAYAGSKQP